jgi:hypothetical protein
MRHFYPQALCLSQSPRTYIPQVGGQSYGIFLSMTLIVSSIRVQDLDHCGIVAGIIDQMGLVEQINQELGTHPQEKGKFS